MTKTPILHFGRVSKPAQNLLHTQLRRRVPYANYRESVNPPPFQLSPNHVILVFLPQRKHRHSIALYIEMGAAL